MPFAPTTLSIPSKVFLIGEYAVLGGKPAWVSTISPRFTFIPPGASEAGGSGFHPESPAGKWIARSGAALLGKFGDPWERRGGFGGSTAEFAFAAYFSGIRDALVAWRAYRSLSENLSAAKRPSGADLVGQWMGGTIEWDPTAEVIRSLTEELAELPILIFSATHLPNRKTATHHHLEGLSAPFADVESFASLTPAFVRAQTAVRARNWRELGHSFSAYADSLAHLGLEATVVRNERLALSRRGGVMGVKGCGAMQTDAMVVIVESLTDPRTDAVIEFAREKYDLRLVARGLGAEPGIREGVG